MTAEKSTRRWLAPGAIRPEGWMRAELEQDRDGFVGHFREICAEAAGNIFVSGRVTELPTPTGARRPGDKRHWWNGETEGKWIDGITRLAHVLGDEATIAQADDHLRRIVRSQDDDGYMGIYAADVRNKRAHCVGDLWTQTFLFLALLTHYEATGDQSLLQATVRAALATIALHGPEGPDHPFTGSDEDSMVLAHNLLVVEPVLRLYELTNNTRFLDFARYCYDEYSRAELGWPESDGQIARMSNPDLPFVGHGAHTCAQLRVPLLLYAATGDERYRDAYEVGFEKIEQVTGASGACKSDECIGTPQDPGVALPEGGYEYCAITELLHTLHLAVMVTGDMRYADRAEHLLMNAAHASRRHDGRGIAYLGADNQYEATKAMGSRWDYSPTHDDIAVCCNPSAARLLPYHVSRMVLATDPGLLVAFYGPAVVDTVVGDVPVTLTMATGFPFSDEVVLDIEVPRSVRFPIHLRVPGWCADMKVVADGAEVRREGDVYVVDGDWSSIRRLTLDFVPEVRVTTAVDGSVVVERGPLVFALDVPAEAHPTREYPVDGFSDVDYVPVAGAQWAYALRFDPADPAASFRVTRRAVAGFPWSKPPIILRTRVLDPRTGEDYYAGMARDVDLVPLGSTLLRRTSFPFVTAPHARARGVEAYPSRDSNP